MKRKALIQLHTKTVPSTLTIAEHEVNAAKPMAPSKVVPSTLLAEQNTKRQKLLAGQRKKMTALKDKHATKLAAFERACKNEQTNASGSSACFSCGAHVLGVVKKTRCSSDSLPADLLPVPAFAQMSRV
jgi:hypothetical protein